MTCGDVDSTVCSSGFEITLLGVDPANFSNDGSATYHYQICDEHLTGQACPYDEFRELSHFDLTFPMLGELEGCLSSETSITGTCTAVDNTPLDLHTAAVGSFGLGDASCFDKTCGGVKGGPTCQNDNDCKSKCILVGDTSHCGGVSEGAACTSDADCTAALTCSGSPKTCGGSGVTSCNNDNQCIAAAPGLQCEAPDPSFVAKCDGTDIKAGDCIRMDLTIAGELTDLGVGAAVVVDKEATQCTASCMAGPSCDTCVFPPPDGEACLTRTIGFWGTHPHIAADYDPVTVCWKWVDGQDANSCSTSEALCTNANDLNKKNNPAYLQFIAQLTAAKLNLNATAALSEDGACTGWSYSTKTIAQWISDCEVAANCNPSLKGSTTSTLCIQALTAFNESQDVGFDQTPSPFDSPGPADPTQCQLARGNGKAIGVAPLTCPAS